MGRESEIDQAVLARSEARWRKVAFIVASVSRDLDDDREVFSKLIGDRIVGLVEAGRLEAQGDLTLWRHSEIRLPAKGT